MNRTPSFWSPDRTTEKHRTSGRKIMSPEEAEQEGDKFSGWRLKSPPQYMTSKVGDFEILYEGQSSLQNIERRTLESRVEAVILLAGTKFKLQIHPSLRESADSWDAKLGRPKFYPKGRGGKIAKPDDPYLSMDPGIELYFRKSQAEKGQKYAPAKYLDFNDLLEGAYDLKTAEWKKGEVDGSRILREPGIEDITVANLRNPAFRAKFGISGYLQKNNSFFSRTSKMGSASFSVMAGSPAIGGTCPATDYYKKPVMLAKQMREIQEAGGNVDHRPADAATWICNYCYAGKSNYIYRNVQWTEVGRWIWLSGMFAHSGYDKAIGCLKYMLKCHLSNVGLREKAGEDPAYFRIHDSGDFNPIPVHEDDRHRFFGGTLDTYDIWHDIISDPAFAKIHFWAPTRMWVSRNWRKRVKLKPPPANFALRPSALHVDDIAPDIEPYAAGSTVHKKKTTFTKRLPNKMNEVILGEAPAKGSNPRARKSPETLADWECPAYTNKNACIGAGGPNGEKNCRVCWEYPDWSVSYKAH